ncbi:glutathione S-transferase N-terminal domain-containing protein, partial [Mycobacterium tuberculosis]|nr:glutathione S-transferase N-terminal domain-containing protein [Mycobacterium tuberculosis]
MLQLVLAGVAFETKSGLLALMRAPKGKLPYLRDDDGTVVADSGFIRDHIERSRGLDLDAGHDARDRAMGWAIEKMLEESVYCALLRVRWMRPAGVAVVERELF